MLQQREASIDPVAPEPIAEFATTHATKAAFPLVGRQGVQRREQGGGAFASGPSISSMDAGAGMSLLARRDEGFAPVANEADVRNPSSPPDPSAPSAPGGAAIDMDEVVEKTLQALMFKLDIERERRGFTRWD